MDATQETRGKTLKRLRAERSRATGKRLTQSKLAKAIGVETQAVSLWENDKVEIQPDNLLRLIEFYGVDPSVLGYDLPSTAGSSSWALEIAAKLEAMDQKLDLLIALRSVS